MMVIRRNEPSIAIIILNYNGFCDTVECIESLEKINYKNFRVVVVDNGSRHKEGLRLKEIFPNIHLIQNEKNRGFTGGNNDGINWAIENDFEYIVCLNNDCTVEPDWLPNLVNGLLTNGADFASSQIMFYWEKNKICSDGEVLFPDGSAIALHRNKILGRHVCTREVFSACAAGAIYSRKSLEAIRIKGNQYFDELYFAYYDDVDLSIRLNIKGYKGIVVPNAIIYHKHSKTSGEYSEFKIFNSEKNRLLNQFLNYPVFLIFLGECFFIIKVMIIFVAPFFLERQKAHHYIENVGFFKLISLFVKARIWIAQNLWKILEDRHERKINKFIKMEIIKYFCWDIIRCAE